jgi:hypothetical protein
MWISMSLRLYFPSFGGEVKPSVPCRRFAACKRSLYVMWKSAFRQNYRIRFSPIKFHLSLLGSLTSHRTWKHLAVTVGTSKTRGEQGSTISLRAALQLGIGSRPWTTTTTSSSQLYVQRVKSVKAEYHTILVKMFRFKIWGSHCGDAEDSSLLGYGIWDWITG